MTCQQNLSLFAEDTLASHSVLPASSAARKMTATSGLKCSALLKSATQTGLLAKMLLDTSAWDSTMCYLTWKVKATPANRLLFQLAPSTRHTEETGSGLLPTVSASHCETRPARTFNKNSQSGRSLGAMAATGQWPTMFATPNTMDHLPPRSEESLLKQAQGHRKGRSRPSNLREQVDPEIMRLWSTPVAHECRLGYQDRSNGKKGTQKSLTTQVIDSLGGRKKTTGQLNPEFVEWLMGYPQGWTELEH